MPDAYIPASAAERIRGEVGSRGPTAVAGDCLRFAGQFTTGAARSFAPPRREFELDERRYPTHWNRRHRSWMTERAVEVPVGRGAVDDALRRGADRILEVGNVLGVHGPISHEVVDKYEEGPGVRNVDVFEIDGGPYDLILSISTLEHVGWDESPRNPDLAAAAVRHLRSRLAPAGTLLVTVPVDYNPVLDAALSAGELPLDRLSAMRRIARPDRWAQVSLAGVWGARYDRIFYSASGVVFGWATGPA